MWDLSLRGVERFVVTEFRRESYVYAYACGRRRRSPSTAMQRRLEWGGTTRRDEAP